MQRQRRHGYRTHASGRRYRRFGSTIAVIPCALRVMRTALDEYVEVELDVLLQKRPGVKLESI